jgi:arginine N-succinyltransferase
LRILEGEGFRSSGMVDIFEAGPIVQCSRDAIRAVRESVRGKIGSIADALPPGAPMVVSNTRADFRACQAAVTRDDGGDLVVSRDTARSLGIEAGEGVRAVAARPSAPKP